MPRGQGYLTVVDPDRPLMERDTLQCSHCTGMIVVKPRTGGAIYLVGHTPTPDRPEAYWWEEVPGARCNGCNRPICLYCYEKSCHALIPCVVWEKAFEASERADRLRRAAGV